MSEESKFLPRLEKVQFGISTFYYFVFNSNLKEYIKASKNIHGLSGHTFFMRLTRRPLIGPDEKAYPMGKIVIKTTKKNDLKKIKEYIPNDYAHFYNEIIYQWPSTEINEED